MQREENAVIYVGINGQNQVVFVTTGPDGQTRLADLTLSQRPVENAGVEHLLIETHDKKATHEALENAAALLQRMATAVSDGHVKVKRRKARGYEIENLRRQYVSPVGDMIRRERHVRGWSADEMAKAIGLSGATVVSLERGGTPSPATVLAVGRWFDIDPAQLAGLPEWPDADLGNRLRILRFRKGWTMRQVADAAGTVHQTISGWELRRVMQPNSPLIGKATMALCGQPAEVLTGEDPGWDDVEGA